MPVSFVPETELPGRHITADTLRIIAHRYYWSSTFVRDKKVLEVGCGPGLGLGYISLHANWLVGVDVTEGNINTAKRHYASRVELARIDAHTLPFREKSVDIILSLATIIYVDVANFVDECHRVLRADGALLLNMPNKDQPGFQPSHLSRKYYSVPELNVLLAQHGFQAEFFGAFISNQAPFRSLTKTRTTPYRLLRRVARKVLSWIRIYWIVRRLISGENATLTLGKELTEEEMETVKNIEVSSLSNDSTDTQHRIIYIIAHPKSRPVGFESGITHTATRRTDESSQ